MTYRIDYCKSELTLNPCRSSTSDSELLSTSNRIETEVKRDRR